MLAFKVLRGVHYLLADRRLERCAEGLLIEYVEHVGIVVGGNLSAFALLLVNVLPAAITANNQR